MKFPDTFETFIKENSFPHIFHGKHKNTEAQSMTVLNIRQMLDHYFINTDRMSNDIIELIKQLESLSNEERVELFGYISLSAIFNNYPVGMIKINLSYKKNINTLNNIEVGDIIKIDDLETEYIVTYIQKNLNTTLHEDKSGTYHVTLPDNINIHMLNRHDGSVNVIDPRDLNITIIGHIDILTALL